MSTASTAMPTTATAAADGALIDLVGMSSGYGGVPVVRGINLHVGPGEVVALLGPNGAGKTTTLLTISGILRLLDGSATVLGSPVVYGSPHKMARRGMGHVPEDRSLFFGLTVAENLKLGLRGSKQNTREAFDRALTLLPALRPLMDRHAGLLSGGEQQMLAVGRAIVAQPKVLMVDEMSLGLAPIIVERLLPIMRSVADETGIGVLLVEQHIHMALTVADRAYVMNHGEIVLEGSGAELSGRRDLLEASYLGDTVLPEESEPVTE
jgi:branched-chain amino acid transport system ATP-binding protein